MAKAANKSDVKPDETPDIKPDETSEVKPDDKPPAEPENPANLTNENEGKRKQLWTDAIAAIARRVKILEESKIAGTVWTIPAIIAISAVIVALIVSFSAIYFVFKGPRDA